MTVWLQLNARSLKYGRTRQTGDRGQLSTVYRLVLGFVSSPSPNNTVRREAATRIGIRLSEAI